METYRDRFFFGSDIDCNPAFYLGPTENYELVDICLVRKAPEKPSTESFLCWEGLFVPLGLDEAVLLDIYFNNHARLHPVSHHINTQLVLAETNALLESLHDRGIQLGHLSEYALDAII